jgi:hypothetical protein
MIAALRSIYGILVGIGVSPGPTIHVKYEAEAANGKDSRLRERVLVEIQTGVMRILSRSPADFAQRKTHSVQGQLSILVH